MGANATNSENNDDVLDDNNVNVDDASKGSNGSDSTSNSAQHNGTEKGGKTFTQEQVNRMMAREKNQGRSAVFNELGIDPKDEKTLAMVKALINSQKSDEQKRLETETEEKNKLAEANHRALVAEAKAEAMQLGVGAQYVDDIVTLALSKLTEDSDLKTIIGEFKTKYPVWFNNSDNDGSGTKDGKGKNSTNTGTKGTGSSVKDQNSGNKDGAKKGLGARLAAQRRGSASKKSYWS